MSETRRVIGESDKARIRALYQAGLTCSQVAAIVGCSHSSAWNHCGARTDEERRSSQCRASAKYAAAHPEKIKETNRRTYVGRKDELRAVYLANKREFRERTARWFADHPGRRRFYVAQRRARQKRSEVEADREAIRALYELAASNSVVTCYLCGKSTHRRKRHVDHIVPLSKGGQHRRSNLAVACSGCNLSKNAKLPAEIGLLL
jgi:5-methylcytosine-specific restriction endonuclease McrA